MARFKASARSVDLLGRQQIAGIPNAVNEIFKNAYDAYAKEVRVDYIENDDIFVVRDNGYGMTREDFENRWLTLGTDSKAIPGHHYVPPKGKRKILGEKGIGRLSIATIGPSVLVVSRANRNGNISKIVVSFICWTLFEIPGISIDEIPIPVKEMDEMPDEEIVAEQINEVRAFYDSLKAKHFYEITDALDNRITQSLSISFFSPKKISHQYVNSSDPNYVSCLNLDESLCGTHFYISPVDSVLSELLSKESRYKKDLNDLQKQLLGFFPTFIPGNQQDMITSLFIYRKDEFLPEDIISPYEFLTVKDYEKADHHFEGAFDALGTFKGKISIYGQAFEQEIPWKNSYGRKPKCGPFEIRIGFLQGKSDESSLNPMDFSYLREKLDRVGGLYIYKDRVRVLPYGDNDYDFLKLEKKRTLSAKHYMFSLRRFVGAILLTNEANVSLQEKAGREGFAKNQAYYDFTSILEDFLESLLINYLREDSSKRVSDVYLQTKSELVKQRSIQKSENERIATIQKAFEKELKEKNSALKSQKKENPLEKICNEIDLCVSQNELLEKSEEKIRKLENYKTKILSLTREISESLNLQKPNSSIGAELFLKYEQYISSRDAYFNEKLFAVREEYLEKIEQSILKEGNRLEHERLFQKRIDGYYAEMEHFLNGCNDRLSSSMQVFSQKRKMWMESFSNRIDKDFRLALQQVRRPVQDGKEVARAIDSIEKILPDEKKDIERFYGFIEDDLKSINDLNPLNESSYTKQEAMIAQGESLLELKKQLDNEYELFQLGTAISIIHHEFGQTTDSLKQAISNLSAWAAANKALQPLYNQLNLSYTHLENYLKLFTPLSKRSKAVKTDVQGKEIFRYIEDLFGERSKKDSIEITQTNQFATGIIRIDRAVILPVFINLVDNAIFWVKMNSLKNGRKIRFDLDETSSILVSDNGPGFPDIDKTIIFERGYTTKPGGRGLGLFIAKQILNECGFDIEAIESSFGKGAGFRIFSKENGEK